MSALLAAVGDLRARTSCRDLGGVLRAYRRIRTALSGAAWQAGQPLVCRRRCVRHLVAWSQSAGTCLHWPGASARPAHTFSDGFVPDMVSALFVEAITWWLEQEDPIRPERWPRAAPLLASARSSRKQGTWQWRPLARTHCLNRRSPDPLCTYAAGCSRRA